MTEYTEERLQNMIIKTLAAQPALKSTSVKMYMLDFKKSFVSISDEAVREAITVFEDDLYLTKPFIYFKKIVSNKQLDLNLSKERDRKKLGSIPKNII